MINHLRTLLINQSGQTYNLDEIGAEIIDPTFRPVKIPQRVLDIWRTLFGTAPDAVGLNYRARQYLGIIHGCGLDQYVTALDPRITYWPPQIPDLWDVTFGFSSQQLRGSVNLNAIGEPGTADGRNCLRRRWTAAMRNQELVITTEGSHGWTETTGPLAFSDGFSLPEQLPDSQMQIQFDGYEEDATWQIEIVQRPTKGVAEVLQGLSDNISPAAVSALFGVNPVEPFLSFRNMWMKHLDPLAAFSGLLLGLGYRIEQLRTAT